MHDDNGNDSNERTVIDYDGQIIVYTGEYMWRDGSVHSCPEEAE